ncbi:putative uncharacterized protein (plasmid) [Caballeronia insecticola]|uniref:Uncharacterized protein n=2 Tax=Caballeronia insecticola TaxID=758793 RepID=R4WSB5_9BURK|nr:putative uncharacterized protein [Caballeronia insecticola]
MPDPNIVSAASTDAAWAEFFEHFKNFDQRRKEQKQRGLNDYSLLAAVLQISDEVRLHSRFLFSMLNPDGAHFQNGAFGQAFMATLGYADWLDWSKVRVFREHDYIDLYLTDGERHVLIENKLNAIDQPGQVSRYIDSVRAWCNEREMPASSDHILFVYLSNGRRTPTHVSLQPYELSASSDGSFVVDKEQRKVARYANAHYRDHIQSWISTCLERVRHVDNLRNAFMEYRLVVERVTKTHKSRVMNLEDFLLEDSAELDSPTRIRHAFEIARQVSSLKAKWLTDMFEAGLRELLDRVARDHLIPIDAAESEDLEPFQFAPHHARRFFLERGNRDAKNKGRFWRFLTRSSFGPIALAVLFGARNLHIGLLPLRLGDSGDMGFDGKRPIDEFKLVHNAQIFEFKQHAAINGVFPGLISWTVRLDEEIENLSRFEDSRSKFVMIALLEHVLKESAALLHRSQTENEIFTR